MDASFYIAKKLSKGDEGSKTFRLSSRISIIAIALGVAALIISFSILEGFDRKLHETAQLFTGDISLGPYSGKGNIPWDETNESNLIDSLRSNGINTDAFDISTLNIGGVLLRKGDFIEGYALLGLDKEEIESFSQYYVEGHPPILHSSGNDGNENSYLPISISESIAKVSQLSIGDTVSLLAALDKPIEAFGMPPSFTVTSMAVITGIYSTGMGEYDKNSILTSKESSHEILFTRDTKASKILLRVDREMWNPSDDELDELAANISDFLSYPYWANSSRSLHYQEFMWIELQKEPIPLVLSLIIIVASFTVMTTMLIGTVEKTRQYGILRAMGLSKSSLAKSVIIQSLSFGFWGLVWGLGVSLSFLALQNSFSLIELDPDIYFIDTLPVEFVWQKYMIVVLFALVLLLLASLLPLYYTGKSTPLKAINYR